MRSLSLSRGVVLALGVVCLSSATVRAESRPLPPVAKQALDSAVSLLGDSQGDERILACIDAMPFLEIVKVHAPTHAFAAGLVADCYYLTDQYENAVPALEKYIELVPPGEEVDAIAEARLRLERTQRIVAEREAAVAVEIAAQAAVPEPAVTETIAARPVTVQAPPKTESADVRWAEQVQPPEEPAFALDDSGLPSRQLAVRAGWSGTAGVLGLGLELRLGQVAFALGTGAYPVSLGGSWVRAAGPGAVYVEGHATWAASSPFVARFESGVGLGLTAGYDWRPVSWLSVKAGVGGGWVSTRGLGLVVDACAGPVFAF